MPNFGIITVRNGSGSVEMLPESERRLDYWIFAELLSQGKSSESVRSIANDFPDKDDFIESFIDKKAYDLGYVKREYLELILLYKLKSSGRSLVGDVKALDAEIRKREWNLPKKKATIIRTALQ